MAANKGIDVKLITPRHSDHLLTDLVRSSYMRELLANEIDLVLFEGQMLHAKAMLVDEMFGMVGSLNFDNRSIFLNYEIVTFVYSEKFMKQFEAWMEDLIAHSSRGITPPSRGREALENIMKVLAPMV